MLVSYTNGQTSVVIRVKILDSSVSTGAGKTGLTIAASGLIISTIADNEATPTTYTVAASHVQTIATLGTYAAPSASNCRFKEVDSVNHPGVYEIQMADARFAVSSAKSLLITITGATGAADCDAVIPLWSVNPYDAVRNGMTALPNANAEAAGGLYTRGTGAGQIKQTNNGEIDANATHVNNVATTPVTTIAANLGSSQALTFNAHNLLKASLTDILDTTLTEGATGRLAGGIVQFFNVASPTSTMNLVTGVTTVTTLTNLPAITTDWLTGTGVAATAVTKIQNGLATPTNITAGTITTVTTLTNLPAAPTDWLTAAAVKADAVTKIQVGLSTSASVATLQTTANNIFSGQGDIATSLVPTNATVANLDTFIQADGSNFGFYQFTANGLLNGPVTSVSGVPAAVWANATGAATATAAAGLRTDYTTARAAKLDNLDVAVSTRLATAGYTAPDNADIVTALADLVSLLARTDPTTAVNAVKVVTDKVATMLAASGGNYTYTVDALKNAPSGGGGGGGFTDDDRTALEAAAADAHAAAVAGVLAPGQVVIAQMSGGVIVQVNGGTNGNEKSNVTLQATRLYPFTYNFTYYGFDSSAYTQFVFTVKTRPDDADTAALVTVQLTNPAAGTDGLTVINGAAPVSPTTATDGSLTVTASGGNTVVTLSLLSRGMNLAATSAFWELTRYSGGEGTKYLVDGGKFMVEKALRQAAVQS